MNIRTTQPNFSKGELGPELRGRFDVDAYGASLALARNVLVLKYGGVTKRPGTHFVSEVVDATHDTRLVPFQFNISQGYALEFGHGYMSPCASGGRVLEDELVITAITNAPQAQIAAAFHGYALGDKVYLTGIAGGLGALLNGRIWPVVAVADGGHFTIDADTSAAPAFSGCSGGIVRTAAPTPAATVPVQNATASDDTPVTTVNYSALQLGGVDPNDPNGTVWN